MCLDKDAFDDLYLQGFGSSIQELISENKKVTSLKFSVLLCKLGSTTYCTEDNVQKFLDEKWSFVIQMGAKKFVSNVFDEDPFERQWVRHNQVLSEVTKTNSRYTV